MNHSSSKAEQSKKSARPPRPKFAIENGKTYIMYPHDRQEFGDFSLKLLGELVFDEETDAQEREGHWVASCSAFVRGILETRTVVLSASAFDSRQRFLEQLRRRFGSGTFNLTGNVVANILADYYSSLKEDASSNPEGRVFFHSNHLGFQKGTYWILASDLHVKDGVILSPSHHQYFLSDSALASFGTGLAGHLLDRSLLKTVAKRFLDLSMHFGANATAFQLATSFVICSGIKAVLTKLGADFSDESCIGVLYSSDRNVGKSLTLSLLAKGQGVDRRSHPLLCSGGDQNVSGTSLKVLMGALQSTTLTCFLDDPILTSSLSEFLLQIQSGLPQGSLKSGLVTPKGSVLISTNSSECSRVHGRILRLDYVKDPNFNRENEELLQNSLKELVTTHKGFLVAWNILLMPRWLNSEQRKVALLDKLRGALSHLVPGQQTRWHKGAAQLIYTFIVFHQVAGVKPNVVDALKLLASSAMERKLQEHSFWQRLEEELVGKLKSPQPVLTWLNPTVSVSVGGNFVPAIAIPSREMSTFTSLKSVEIPDEIQKVTDPQKAKTSTILFAVDGTATAQDVRRKTDKSRNIKGYKIPKTCLSSRLINQIEIACGLRNNVTEPADQETLNEYNATNKAETLSEETIKEIMDCVEKLKEFDRDSESDDDGDDVAFPGVREEMSPMSSLRYSVLTPQRQKVFQEGLKAGRRIEKRKIEGLAVQTAQEETLTADTTSTTTAAIVNQPAVTTSRTTCAAAVVTTRAATVPSVGCSESALEEVTPRNRRTQSDEVPQARRALFDCADGSVGVLKRKQAEKNTEADADVCQECKQESPPNKKGRRSKEVSWVSCDKCQRWFHVLCTPLKATPKKQDTWKCTTCSK